MYQNSTARIKLISKVSETFEILAGTEQGHPMSPELFKTYIHELSERLNNIEGLNCPILNETVLTHLLWADDLVLLALSKESLQLMIDELQTFCTEWGLTVNIKKTAVMVFNKSGRQLKESSGFQYIGNSIPSTKTYCYLGITFAISGSFKVAINLLRQKALRAYFGLKGEVDFQSISKTAALKLVDSLVLPVVSYGIEVWIGSTAGIRAFSRQTTSHPNQSMLTDLAADTCERLHLAILKWTLGVGKKSSNAAIWGDCGRAPLIVRYVKQVTDYYNRLARLDLEDSTALVRNAFAEQKKLGLKWYNNLNSLLKILDHKKLEHQHYNALLCQERALARFTETWETERHRNKKLQFYNKMKESFGAEPYLEIQSNKGTSCVAKIRMSGHRLKIETGRYGIKSNSGCTKSVISAATRQPWIYSSISQKSIQSRKMKNISSEHAQGITSAERISRNQQNRLSSMISRVYSLRSTSRNSLDTCHLYSKRDSRKDLEEEAELRKGPEELRLLRPPLTGRKNQMEGLSTKITFTQTVYQLDHDFLFSV